MDVSRDDLEVASRELVNNPLTKIMRLLFWGGQGLPTDHYHPGTRDDTTVSSPAGSTRHALSGHLVLAFVAVGIGLIFVVAWFSLQRDENWIRCEDKNPDVRIAGCTAVIQFGQNAPNLGEAFYDRATAYAEKGETDRAIQDFDQAISLNPKLYQSFLQRGMAYLNKGDNDHAIQDFGEAIRLNPTYVLGFHNRGIAFWLKGDTDAAMQDFNQAIKLDPKVSQPFYQRGRVYADKGDHNRAIQDFDQTIRLNPTHLYAITFRGISHLKTGHYDRAIADWNTVLKLDANGPAFPKRADLLYCRGVAKRLRGDTVDGDADIAAAKDLNANIAEAMAKLGVKP
jgi:tetratricopeptide (TPR) repeat protein